MENRRNRRAKRELARAPVEHAYSNSKTIDNSVSETIYNNISDRLNIEITNDTPNLCNPRYSPISFPEHQPPRIPSPVSFLEPDLPPESTPENVGYFTTRYHNRRLPSPFSLTIPLF